MASLASINIKFTADLKQFSSQMENVNRSLTKTGKNLQRVGTGLTASISLPLLGLGAIAVKSAADLETLKTSLDTVFSGDKSASSAAFNEIKEFAATTPFQLDEVATAFIKLKNLGLDPSIDSLTSYGNTASALGKSLDQMIEAVADASVGEFERLKEFGIKAKSEGDNVAFTFQGVTTTVAKNSQEIQNYLLDIGNTNFAGSIERQANTFNGKLSTLKDNLTNAFASIGEVIIDYINPLFNKLNSILTSFQELSPTTKKWIVILGGIAAAIGPLLALAGTILPAIGTGFALLTGPIGLIIAGLTAIGIIIYKNWKPIKQTLIDIANYFVDLYNESMAFRAVTQLIIGTFKTLFEVGKFAFETIKDYLSGLVDGFTSGFKTIGKIIKAVFTGNLDEIPDIIKNATAEGLGVFKNFTDDVGSNWDNLMEGVKTVANDTLENIVTKKKLKYFGENVDTTEITDAVADATAKGLVDGLVKGGTGSGLASTNFEAPEMFDLDGLNSLFASTGVNIDEASADATGESFISGMREAYEADIMAMDEAWALFVEGFEERAEHMAQVGITIGDAVGGAFESLSGSMVDSLKLADHGLQGFIKSLLKGITKIIAGLLSQSIASAIAGGTSAGASTGPAAVATIPAFVASLIATVIGAFASIPKFETGGVVGGNSFIGDKILARVNSGELILNSRQQKSVLSQMNASGGQVDVSGEFKLRGEDMIMVLDRANKKQNRRS